MGLCVVIGLAIGHYLDKYFTTYPYLYIYFYVLRDRCRIPCSL